MQIYVISSQLMSIHVIHVNSCKVGECVQGGRRGGFKYVFLGLRYPDQSIYSCYEAVFSLLNRFGAFYLISLRAKE
jgi:hypothetical protein